MEERKEFPPLPPPGNRRLCVRNPARDVNAVGMFNTGSICWFNSLVQALLSVGSFNRYVEENEQYLRSNKIAMIWLKLFQNSLKSGQDLDVVTDQISKTPQSIIEVLKTMSNLKSRQFDLRSLQQQCAHEGFVKLIEALATEGVDDLFRQITLVRTRCVVCNEYVSSKRDHRVFAPLYLPITPPKTSAETIDATTAFHKQLGSTASYVDEYRCEKCNTLTKGSKTIQTTSLRVAREVIVVAFISQYHQTSLNWYPETLHIPRTSTRKYTDATGNEALKSEDAGEFVYRVVAQIHHRGGATSGHYYADCLRADGVYRLNDSSVTKIKGFEPAPSVVMVFYELSAIRGPP